MHTLYPFWDQVGTITPLLISPTMIPVFFGTTWTRLSHLELKIGYIISTWRSLIISFLTTSIIGGFNLLWAFLLGLQSSSMRILHVLTLGQTHFISAIVYLMASLWSSKTLTNWSSSKSSIERRWSPVESRIYLGKHTSSE